VLLEILAQISRGEGRKNENTGGGPQRVEGGCLAPENLDRNEGAGVYSKEEKEAGKGGGSRRPEKVIRERGHTRIFLSGGVLCLASGEPEGGVRKGEGRVGKKGVQLDPIVMATSVRLRH